MAQARDFGAVTLTLNQGYDTSLDHGYQFCEIFSRSDKGKFKEVMAGQDVNRWTDGVIPIYPNFFVGLSFIPSSYAVIQM